MDQTGRQLTLAAIGLGLFVVGALVGWIGHGASGRSDGVSRISFYDDWRLACPSDKDVKEKKATCELATDAVDTRSGTKLAQITIGRQEGKVDSRVMIVTVPLTVLIPAGVGLQVGTNTQIYQYVTCVPAGCVATVPVDDKLIDSLSATQSLALVVQAQNGKSVSLPVSIKGFSAASNTLKDIEARRASWWRRMWS